MEPTFLLCVVDCYVRKDGLEFLTDGRKQSTQRLKKLLHIIAHVGKLVDRIPIGFEVDHICLIKADQSHEQPDVRFCETWSSEVALLVQDCLHPVQ